MSSSIQNIVAILNGYANGRLFECKKEKRRRKASVEDLVSISDEARDRVEHDGSENRGDRAEDAIEN